MTWDNEKRVHCMRYTFLSVRASSQCFKICHQEPLICPGRGSKWHDASLAGSCLAALQSSRSSGPTPTHCRTPTSRRPPCRTCGGSSAQLWAEQAWTHWPDPRLLEVQGQPPSSPWARQGPIESGGAATPSWHLRAWFFPGCGWIWRHKSIYEFINTALYIYIYIYMYIYIYLKI